MLLQVTFPGAQETPAWSRPVRLGMQRILLLGQNCREHSGKLLSRMLILATRDITMWDKKKILELLWNYFHNNFLSSMLICHGVDKQEWTFKNVYLTLRQVLFNYKVRPGLQVSHLTDMLLSNLDRHQLVWIWRGHPPWPFYQISYLYFHFFIVDASWKNWVQIKNFWHIIFQMPF